MVTFDLELFNKLLFSLHTLVKTNISFFDGDFEGTYACTSPMHPLCRVVKDHDCRRCSETDTAALTHCKYSQVPDHHYACHLGMKEMIFKMSSHNETYGYIFVGPFRDKQNDAFALQKIKAFSKEFALDEQELVNMYFATSAFSEEKFEAVKTMLYTMFDYAVHKNIITMKHTAFEMVITAYINDHLSEDLSLEKLCKHFYLSFKQLHSVMKKATGLPPKQYIIQQRIAEAKRLLTTTDRPIQTIAESVGIPDYSYFIKVFKSATGQTPVLFRKQQK